MVKKKKAKKIKLKDKKAFELWANKKLKEIQVVMQMTHFCLNPIRQSNKADTSYSITHYPYKDITIEYGGNVYEDWKAGNKESALGILIHELTHPLTDPLYCKATNRYVTPDELADERESLTDHIANIILQAKLIKP